jgi:hypothetical protein
VSPASGVRAAPHDPFRSAPVPPPAPATPDAAFTPVRLPFDSSELVTATQVGPPDPSLLALARGELAKQAALAQQAALVPLTEAMPHGVETVRVDMRTAPRRLVWFLFGLGVGAAAFVAWAALGDVTADVYRARLWAASTLRSVRGRAVDDAPVPLPASTVAVAPQVIPTIDVTQLPKAASEPAQAPRVAPALAPPAPPGAPALQQAPGPR